MESEEKKLRFLADRMLGKLTTWLRILGHDTAYAGNMEKELLANEDKNIVSLAKKEERVLLTRDKGLAALAKKENLQYVYLRADEVMEQIKELLSAKINIKLEPTMKRCSECNGRIRKIKEERENLLRNKEYVPKNMIGRKEFWICESCGKIYWEGSHWRSIEERLEQLKGGNVEKRG